MPQVSLWCKHHANGTSNPRRHSKLDPSRSGRPPEEKHGKHIYPTNLRLLFLNWVAGKIGPTIWLLSLFLGSVFLSSETQAIAFIYRNVSLGNVLQRFPGLLDVETISHDAARSARRRPKVRLPICQVASIKWSFGASQLDFGAFSMLVVLFF